MLTDTSGLSQAQSRALAPLLDGMRVYSRFRHERFDPLEDLQNRMDP